MRIGNIFILILAITLLNGCSKRNSDLINLNQDEDVNDYTVRENILFDTHNDNFIILDGKSITLDGENAIMEIDIDKDKNKESISIKLDHPNGTRVMYYDDNIGMNLLDETINNPLENTNAFDEMGNPNYEFYYQVSCYDLDNDGTDEIILSMGNMLTEMVSLIYRVTDSKDVPMVYVGAIYGQENMYITSQNHIYVPYGTVGLFNDYIYLDDRLYAAVY